MFQKIAIFDCRKLPGRFRKKVEKLPSNLALIYNKMIQVSYKWNIHFSNFGCKLHKLLAAC